VITVSVCVFVCLSVRHNISGSARPIFSNFLMHVTDGRGSVRSSSGGVAIRYVLPGSWVTSVFRTLLTRRVCRFYGRQ